MYLERVHRKPAGWAPRRNDRGADGKLPDPSRPEGELLNPPPIDHFKVRDTGVHATQNFSTRLIQAGLAEGWASIADGKLTLKAEPESLVYKILRGPGHYCCHCGERLTDAAQVLPGGGTRGQLHVAVEHTGKESPDRNNPSGYMRLNEYQCVLDPKQHERFKAPPGQVRGLRMARGEEAGANG